MPRLPCEPMPATHVLICTHTTRHLRRTLLGVAAQTPRPASVVVSIDNDKDEIRDLCAECSREMNLPMIVAWRPWPGEVRVGQVRNNGVRALLARPGCDVAEDDWMHLLDGDSVMPPGMLAEAQRIWAGRTLVIGGRVLLTEDQTAAFDESRLASGRDPVELSAQQRTDVATRHARYLWQLRLKPFGFVKMHKPKVLGANHACTVGMYRKVGGYDETFLGAWREDDDFGRRVYLAGGRGRVAVTNVCVYHLWHPLNPQKRENWSELPGNSTRPRHEPAWRPLAGLSTPAKQLQVQACRLVAGREVQRWATE